MQSKAATPEAYIAEIPAERQAVFKKLRAAIKKNLPIGFKEVMGYGMIGYVVPHSKYPDGYYCKPADPLPFMNIASQKNFIAVYHMGISLRPDLLKWFNTSYEKLAGKKSDMGKACLRYKKPEEIPVDLIGELATKITTDEWIAMYEKNIKRKK